MMEANRRRNGGRPRDTCADLHVDMTENKDGKVIKKCKHCDHRFTNKTSATRIKAHLGGVSGYGVAPCEGVPFNVKEAARKAMPSSSSNPILDVNIPTKSDMQQPHSQDCTLGPSPSQTMPSVHEQCPSLMDDRFQQSNVDSTCLDEHPGEIEIVIPEDVESLEDLLANPPPVPASSDNMEAFLDGFPDQNVAPWENVPNCLPYENVIQNATIRDTMLDASIPQDLLQEHPMQQHLGEVPYCLPYEDEQQDAAMMDSMLDVSLSQDFLQGGDYPNSLPHSAHQEDVPIAEFNNHGGLESQHHMQENLQGDQRVNSLEQDLYPSIEPQLHHMHIDISESLHVNPPPSSEPESDNMDIVPSSAPSDTRPTASDQTRPGNKRKFPDKVPSGKKLPLGKKYPVPTFVRKEEEIYASLQDDSVSRIGVYGMGGCGKTTVMKCIHNQLVEDRFMPFTDVVWVTVSLDCTISKLQRSLARKLDLKLADDGDREEWAIALNDKMQKMCYALILDDLWDAIKLEDVGIPMPTQENRCKMILTTRELGVCNKMDCSPAISLGLLSEKEAWDLFVFTLNVAPKDSIIEGIMKEIAKECAHLPLAIVIVAGSMKGNIKLFECRNALDSLRRQAHGFTEMDEKVIPTLKFSYDRLCKQRQQCLLYCALYPEDYRINRQELIEMWINEGTIGSTESLLSAYDEGRTVINKLVDACLLIVDGSCWVIMHDLIRDMCLDIAGGRFLVKCGSKFPPNESEYTKDVEKVSLVRSYFKEIPSHMVPHCPELSSLLLSENYWLTRVADSFFIDLPRLKVLNLSCTSIEELPNSVTNLVSLSALVLRHCQKLKRLPCLAPLKTLKKLDLCGSTIEEAPKGVGELVNLTYLDLYGTHIWTLPSSTLGNLVKLQYLKTGRVRIMMNDVKGLKDLKTFEAEFVNLEEYREYVNSVLDNGRGPPWYVNSVLNNGRGRSEYDVKAFCQFKPYGLRRYVRDGIVKVDLILGGDERSRGDTCLSDEVIEIIIPSPEIVDALEVKQRRGNHFVISEVEREVSSSLHKSSTRLHIKQQTEESGELKCLFDAKLLLAFPNLSTLEVTGCDHIEELISTSPSVGVFSSSLKELTIEGCNKLVRLIDLKVLSYFQNLEEIWIGFCKSLESIASTANPIEKEEESNNPISFPKLRRLDLHGLRNLRSICDCDDTLICPSIEWIRVRRCPKLKRLPLQVPELDNNRRLEIGGEREWWESLEWDHPDAKTLLQPYFVD